MSGYEFDLSVVIVTHNHRQYIQRCLESLEQARDELRLEVQLIDNYSDDDTTRLVVERHPWVNLFASQTRRGFAANNNIGIQRAVGRYILLLNPDTEVLPGALSTLVAFMDEHPEAGTCGAQLLFPDLSIQPSCRRFPTVLSVLVRRTPLRWFLRDSRFNARHLMLDFDHQQTQEVDWMLGACLIVRREMIEDVGLMDEGYHLYAEDIDWCYRMRQRGWKVFYVPDAEIIHHHQAVSDNHLLGYHTWIHTKSMLRFYRKHLAPSFLRLWTV